MFKRKTLNAAAIVRELVTNGWFLSYKHVDDEGISYVLTRTIYTDRYDPETVPWCDVKIYITETREIVNGCVDHVVDISFSEYHYNKLTSLSVNIPIIQKALSICSKIENQKGFY